MRNDELFFSSFDGIWRYLSADLYKQKLQIIFFLEFSSSLANLAMCRNITCKSKPRQFHSIHHRRWTFYFPSKRAKCMKNNRLIVFLLKYSNTLKIIFNCFKIPCPHWHRSITELEKRQVKYYCTLSYQLHSLMKMFHSSCYKFLYVRYGH